MSASRHSTFVRPALATRWLACAIDWGAMSIDVNRARALRPASVTGLGANTAANLEHHAPARVPEISVQKSNQRPYLIIKLLALTPFIAASLGVAHRSPIISARAAAASAAARAGSSGSRAA
jgi:hypothetical protein